MLNNKKYLLIVILVFVSILFMLLTQNTIKEAIRFNIKNNTLIKEISQTQSEVIYTKKNEETFELFENYKNHFYFLVCDEQKCRGNKYDGNGQNLYELFSTVSINKFTANSSYYWDTSNDTLYYLSNSSLIKLSQSSEKNVFEWNITSQSLTGGPFCNNLLFISGKLFYCKSMAFGGDKTEVSGKVYTYNISKDTNSLLNIDGKDALGIFKNSKNELIILLSQGDMGARAMVKMVNDRIEKTVQLSFSNFTQIRQDNDTIIFSNPVLGNTSLGRFDILNFNEIVN